MTISTIIPIYNSEKHLQRCIDSVLAAQIQEVENEIILVNDGSTDASLEICEKYAATYSNIKVFSQENKGPSAARNYGITNAKGKYLFFVDADDWIIKDSLKVLVNAMEREDVDLVCAGYFEVNDRFKNGLKLHDFNEKHFQNVLNRQNYQQNLFNGVSGVLWAKLFKNDFFQKHKILLNPEVRLSEDLLVMLEYSTLIESVLIIEDPIYYYNRKEDLGLSGKLKDSNIQDLKLTNSVIYSYKNLLSTINIDEILRKRKANFIVKFLKDNLQSYGQFKDSINLIKEKFEPDVFIGVYQFKGKILFMKFLSKERYRTSFALLKIEYILRKVKRKVGL